MTARSLHEKKNDMSLIGKSSSEVNRNVATSLVAHLQASENNNNQNQRIARWQGHKRVADIQRSSCIQGKFDL
jgi:hypothetical protein